MSTTTVAIPEQAFRRLAEIAEWTGVFVELTLERAVSEAHKLAFWEAVNAGYAALRADPQAWAEELAERQLWETTLADGLDLSEEWNDDGTVKVKAPEEQAK